MLIKGQKVRHKITGQIMTVKRGGEVVVTCVKEIPEPYMAMGFIMPGDIAVCLVANLEILN